MTTVSEAKGAILSAVDAYGEAVEAAAVAPVQAELDAAVRLTIEQAETIASLRTQLAALQPKMWVGADVNVPGGTPADNTLANFMTASEVIGPLTYRRIFRALGTAQSHQEVRDNWARGIRTVGSFAAPNGDYAGLASGKYNSQVASWAAEVATIPGVYWTAIHEPEAKLPGEQFQAIHDQLYPVVKNANPDISWGPIYMTYWWLPARLATKGGADAWQIPDNRCDFRAGDQYAVQPGPLETDAEFRGWYDLMPDTKPLLLTEYGVYVVPPGQQPDPAKLARRAEVIRADHAWLVEQDRFDLISYWHGYGSKGNWALEDPESQAAWREVSAAGRTT